MTHCRPRRLTIYCTIEIEEGDCRVRQEPKNHRDHFGTLLPGQTTPLRLSPDQAIASTPRVTLHSQIPILGSRNTLIAEIGTELLFWPIPDDDYTAYLTVAILPRFPMGVPEYGTDISFDSATKQIRRVAGSFINPWLPGRGYGERQWFGENDGDYTISCRCQNCADRLGNDRNDEAAGETVVISSTPEIPEQYHRDLIDYVCHLAYKKNGKKTLDLQRSMTHLELFTAVFGPRNTASIEQMRVGTQSKDGEKQQVPHIEGAYDAGTFSVQNTLHPHDGKAHRGPGPHLRW